MLLIAAGQSSHSTLPEQLLARAAEQPFGLGVDVGEAPLAVEAVEAGRHGLEHPGDVRRALALAGGVVGGPEEADDRAVGVGERSAAGVHPAGLAVRPDDAVLRLELAARVDAGLHGIGHPDHVVGVQAVVERLDVLLEGRGLVAEHREQPVVPRQPAGGHVEVEGADPGGVDRQPPAQPLALVLAGPGR